MFREQVDLHAYNTLALRARAAYLCEPAVEDELQEALRFARVRNLPVLPLGEGSNVVLIRDYPGLVIRLVDARVQVEQEDETSVLVRVGAGMRWHSWVEKSLQNAWYGLENLALIPGTVGAAPVQNVGAYGVEVAPFIDSVRGVWIDTGEACELDRQACCFAYRDSIFKGELARRVIITSVVFRLNKVAQVHVTYAALQEYLARYHQTELQAGNVTPALVKDAVCAIRRSRLPDPQVLPNVGSFFKNPQISPEQFSALQKKFPAIVSYPGEQGRVKLAAAWLIDQLGWKGRCQGAACVHDKQALVLLNRGGAASGTEIMALADAIAADVLRQFAVPLEPEPWVW